MLELMFIKTLNIIIKYIVIKWMCFAVHAISLYTYVSYESSWKWEMWMSKMNIFDFVMGSVKAKYCTGY